MGGQSSGGSRPALSNFFAARQSPGPAFQQYGQPVNPYAGNYIAQRQFQLGMPGQQTGYNMNYIRRPPSPQMNFSAPAPRVSNPYSPYGMASVSNPMATGEMGYFSPEVLQGN